MIRNRRVFVEKRGNEDRENHVGEDDEEDSDARPPEPPAFGRAAEKRIQHGESDCGCDKTDGELRQLFTEPRTETLIRQAIGVLAKKVLVDVEWERENKDEQSVR